MRPLPRLLIAVVVVAQSLSASASCIAVCKPARNSKTGLSGTVSISIPTGLSESDAAAFMDGIEMWTDVLAVADVGFNFNVLHSGTGDIQLVIDPDNLSGGAENATDASGLGQIRVSPTYLDQNKVAFWRHVIAHELGHSIGFANHSAAGCEGQTIMFDSIGVTGPFMSSLSDCDEQATENAFGDSLTLDKGCASCWTTCDTDGSCPPPPVTTPPGGYSPILIDLGGDGFRLSSFSRPVTFDLDADGDRETTSWTTAGSDDAFLAFDRNANGVIDDGSELFGNATPLPDGGRAAHGYLALAVFDQPSTGGNLDGVIDHHDRHAQDLLLWIDGDHDGISRPYELQSLASAGVTTLHLDVRVANRKDRHGNVFRYRARALMLNAAGHARQTVTYDVFFVAE